MDKQVEDKIWQYLDGELDAGQQDIFKQEMQNDPLLSEKFAEIQGLHQMLKTQPQEQVPDFLSDQIMQSITAAEIEKELAEDKSSLAYIPYIIGGFAILLTTIITIALLIGGLKIDSGDSTLLQFKIPTKVFHYLAYLSLLTLLMLIFYKFSIPGFNEKFRRKG